MKMMSKSSSIKSANRSEVEQRAARITRDRKFLLSELINIHRDILRSSHKDANTEKLKNAAWAKITDEFNATSNDQIRTVTQIKRIWSKQASESRQELADYKKSALKTGGGPGNKTPDQLCDKVSEFYGKSNPIISGCSGFESSIFGVKDTNVDRNVESEWASENDDSAIDPLLCHNDPVLAEISEKTAPFPSCSSRLSTIPPPKPINMKRSHKKPVVEVDLDKFEKQQLTLELMKLEKEKLQLDIEYLKLCIEEKKRSLWQ